MTFTVTYRAKDGALREERVEAASRAECVAECRRRGITPTEIKEGRSGKSAASPKGRDGARPEMKRRDAASPRGWAPWVVVAVAIAAVVGGVWWWAARPKSAPSKPAATSAADPAAARGDKAETPAKPKATSVQQQVAEKLAEATNVTEIAPTTPAVGVGSAGKAQKSDAAKPTWPPPPAQRDENGRVVPPPGAITLDSQESIFKHNSDTYIAMLISPRPGETLPPMPAPGPAMEEEFLASLKEPIETSPDDSPEDRATKLAVAAAREEIKRLLDTGAKFADIVSEHEQLLKDNNEAREKALAEYREILKSGDEKGAEKYFTMVNIALQQMGAAPMEKSKSHEEVRARMLEARTRKQQEVGK